MIPAGIFRPVMFGLFAQPHKPIKRRIKRKRVDEVRFCYYLLELLEIASQPIEETRIRDSTLPQV